MRLWYLVELRGSVRGAADGAYSILLLPIEVADVWFLIWLCVVWDLIASVAFLCFPL